MTRAYSSTVIDAPVSTVWSHLRDFTAVGTYLDTVEVIDVTGAGDRVGCVRTARHRENGAIFREQLIALSDAAHSMSYTQLEFPVIEHCIITARLRPVVAGDRTFIEWFADFDVLEGDPVALVHYLERDVYERCFEGLQRLVAAPVAA